MPVFSVGINGANIWITILIHQDVLSIVIQILGTIFAKCQCPMLNVCFVYKHSIPKVLSSIPPKQKCWTLMLFSHNNLWLNYF